MSPNTSQTSIVIQFDDSVSQAARYAIARVLEKEGGYVNDPLDKGGETKYGITKRWYPELDIKNLTIDDAAKIYHKEYWRKNQCHRLPKSIALILFDCAVNIGGLFARKALQESLNLTQDGVIGPKTLGRAITEDCTVAGCTALGIRFTGIRCRHYANLVQNDHEQARFIEGWVDRALDILVTSFDFDAGE